MNYFNRPGVLYSLGKSNKTWIHGKIENENLRNMVKVVVYLCGLTNVDY
jgi:hypothetical protein